MARLCPTRQSDPSMRRHGAGHPRRPRPRDLPRGFYVTAHQWTRGGSAVSLCRVSRWTQSAGHRSSHACGGQGTTSPRGRARPALARRRDLGLLALGLAKDRLQKSMAGGDTSSMHPHSPADVDLGCAMVSELARGYSASFRMRPMFPSGPSRATVDIRTRSTRTAEPATWRFAGRHGDRPSIASVVWVSAGSCSRST